MKKKKGKDRGPRFQAMVQDFDVLQDMWQEMVGAKDGGPPAPVEEQTITYRLFRQPPRYTGLCNGLDPTQGFSSDDYVWPVRLDDLKLLAVIQDSQRDTRFFRVVTFEDSVGLERKVTELLTVDFNQPPTRRCYKVREHRFKEGDPVSFHRGGEVTLHDAHESDATYVLLNGRPQLIIPEGEENLVDFQMKEYPPEGEVTRENFRQRVKPREPVGEVKRDFTGYYVAYRKSRPALLPSTGTCFEVGQDSNLQDLGNVFITWQARTELQIDPIQGYLAVVPLPVADEDDDVGLKPITVPGKGECIFVMYREDYAKDVIQLTPGKSSLYIDVRPYVELLSKDQDVLLTDEQRPLSGVTVPIIYGRQQNPLLPIIDPVEVEKAAIDPKWLTI